MAGSGPSRGAAADDSTAHCLPLRKWPIGTIVMAEIEASKRTGGRWFRTPPTVAHRPANFSGPTTAWRKLSELQPPPMTETDSWRNPWARNIPGIGRRRVLAGLFEFPHAS